MLERKLAIIPVWRELGRIGDVITRFDMPYVDEVYLAVDEPTPGLLDEIDVASQKAKVEIRVVINPRRMGIGYCIRKGLQYALDRNYDVVVVMAGNGKDDPREIPKLLKAIEDGFDYVQGSRFLLDRKHERIPIVRRMFVRSWPLLWVMLTLQRCTDVANGFRAYKTKLLKDPKINIDQAWLDRYGLEYYIHYKALTSGYRFCEVPVSKIYPNPGGDTYSRIYPFRDFWEIVLPLILLRLGFKK